jgi:DNA-binding CsgD family transcriptional regulator
VRNAESNADLRAALLWDVPALRASSSPSARAFLQILYLREPTELTEPSGEKTSTDPLGIAAAGLTAELKGETESALGFYRSLAENSGLVSALGWALLTWSQDSPPDALEGARIAAEAIDEPILRAHYYCKLTTFTLDRGQREEAEHFFELAARNAGDSPLGTTLRFVGFNMFGRGLTVDTQLLRGARDPLVDLPWIHEEVENNARQTLVQSVVDRAESPWRRTLRFGTTVVQAAQAAELQATWAGALWMLPSIRLQLGAQLLTAASSPAEASLGVAMWVLGGGSSLSSIMHLAERLFDNESGDALLNQHLVRGRRIISRQRFLEVAAAAWDLISDETAAGLLTELEPTSSQEPDEDRVRSLWAVLATRVPEVWATQFKTLDRAAQSALLDSLTPEAAAFLPRNLLGLLLRLAKSRLLAGGASENLYVLYASLLRRAPAKQKDDDALVAIRQGPPEVIARLGRTDPDLIGVEAVARAAEELHRQVLAENDEARKGTSAIRSFDCRVRLGLALASLPAPPRHLTEALVDTAMDRAIVADYRLNALRGLIIMAQAGVLEPALAKPLTRMPSSTGPSWFSDVSDRLFEAAVRAVTALAAPRDDDDIVLLGASRDPDPRVRDLAVDTASHVIRHRGSLPEVESPMLTLSLFGALFDPAETVLLDALDAVPTLFNERLREVVIERLQHLFASSGSSVRAAVAQVAVQLSAHGTTAALGEIIDSARTDRSWKVRNMVRAELGASPSTEQNQVDPALAPEVSLSPALSLGLTRREIEVLALVVAGRSNREIGEVLSITPHTARTHVSNILAKLGAANRDEVAAIAQRLGLRVHAGE